MEVQDTVVLKFGGTSVKSIGRIQHVANIVETAPARKRLVVVSAMGDATDYLYGLGKQCSELPDKRELDMLLATGEQVSIALLALTLRARGINARSFTGQQIGICTDDVHSDARILECDPERLERALEQCDVAVIAGFQGCSAGGDITTLGRGGSDTTAVAIAIASGADECCIYTDVDGVFSADPNRIPDAALLHQVSYEDTIALAKAGAQVIHPRAVELAREHNVKLRIRNTFKPAAPGSLILGDENMEKIHHAYAVAVDNNQALCALTGIASETPVLSIISEKLSQEGIGIEALSQYHSAGAKRNLLLAIRFADADRALAILREFDSAIGAEDVTIDTDTVRISLVGIGCGISPSLAANSIASLESSGIGVKLATSGDTRMSFFVSKSQSENAARILHAQAVDTRARVA